MDGRNHFAHSVGIGSAYINYIWRSYSYSCRNCTYCDYCSADKRQTSQLINEETDIRCYPKKQTKELIIKRRKFYEFQE